mgnify:FL=1
MDKLQKFFIADGKVLITVIKDTELVEEARKIHGLTPTTTAVLGRCLTVAAFMSSGFKDENQRLSFNIDGKGPIGKIVVSARTGAEVKGYVENPSVDLPIRADGKIDVGGAVGTDGEITVIKDLGLKEPYTGKCKLVSGEIAEDFAYYFTTSEQQPSAVALGVLVDKNGVKTAGGIFIQPMPGCNDMVITMLEDICTNFTHISSVLDKMEVDEIIDYYFGHFDVKTLPPQTPKFKCDCSRELIERVIMAVGKKEAYDIIDKDKKIEVGCQFCNKKYVFNKEDIDKIFGE